MNSNVVQMHNLLSSSRLSSGGTEFVYSYFCFTWGEGICSLKILCFTLHVL